MEITACPVCGSTDIGIGTLGDGIISGLSSWKEVCHNCGYQGASLLFDSEEAYQRFLKALKDGTPLRFETEKRKEKKPVNTEKNKKSSLRLRIISQGILAPLVIIAIIFLLAGRLDYWQGWGYNILNTFFIVLTVVLLADRPDLLKERLRPGEGMKAWDRIYFLVSTPMFFLMLLIACLDTGRGFGWTPMLPFSVYLLGYGLYILGQSLFLWSKRTNRFFSSVVRIQTERNQQVCQEGPYRFIRHPGYLSGILFTLATPIILGSLWALIPAAIAALSLIVRTYLEDVMLKKELPGYVDYVKKVRYRLIPGVW
jgi:protein-S-isoprenylcysteine O-methyltransferase Ste14